MTAQATGRLLVEAGCVRIRAEGAGDRPGDVIVWPAGYSLARIGGEVLVLGRKERVEARIGDEVSVGGDQIGQDALAEEPEAQRRAFEEVRRR